MFTRRGGAGRFGDPKGGGAAGPVVNPPVEIEVKKEVEVKPSTVKTQNVFTPMDKQVTPSISPVSYEALYGEDATKPKNVSQYRNLTDLMKMNMDSLSGKIKIPDARYPAGNVFVPPGYDSDMVPFAVKISADRLNIDPKEYMNMGLMDRVKNFGTEAKSMGQELTTGVGQAIDAGKQLVSNLPMFNIFGGSGSDAGNQQEVINEEVIDKGVGSLLTGDSPSMDPRDMQQFPSATMAQQNPLTGMSPEMLQYYLGLSDVDKQAFLGLDNAGRLDMMRNPKGQEDQNFNFLGQYSTSGPVKDMT